MNYFSMLYAVRETDGALVSRFCMCSNSEDYL